LLVDPNPQPFPARRRGVKDSTPPVDEGLGVGVNGYFIVARALSILSYGHDACDTGLR